MQFLDGRLIVSPSDLTGFLECEHLTQQELRAARGEIARPERDDPMLDMLSRRGLEHEGKHLAEFRAKGVKTVEFPFPEGTIAEGEVPAGTLTLKLCVWPVASVTVTVHWSADAEGIAAIPITANTVASEAAAVFSLRRIDNLTRLLPGTDNNDAPSRSTALNAS